MTHKIVKLAQIKLSRLNVRTASPSSIEELAADIAAHGLIQNLSTYEEDGDFHVFAGGRRLHALQLLVKTKRIKPNHPVAITVRDKAEAVELSISENIQREDMHPADLCRALVKMRDETGSSVEAISLRFGFTVTYVQRLLKLGALAPTLLDAYAADDLSTDTAKALAISDDHEQQEAAFAACGNSPHAIRRYLSEGHEKTSGKLFKFVGEAEYTAAGGTLTRDLFSDEALVNDHDILQQLINAKLGQLEAELQAQGWPQVAVTEDGDTVAHYYAILRPNLHEMTDEQEQRLEAIEEEISELRRQGKARGEPLEALNDERRSIESSLEYFTDEQKANGQVFASIGWSGKAEIRYLVKAAEQEKPEKTATGPYSAAMTKTLSSIRTVALQRSVATQPDLALNILLDTLIGQVFHDDRGYQHPVNIEISPAHLDVAPDLMDGSNVAEGLELYAAAFRDIPAEGRLQTLQTLPLSDRLQMLAYLVATSLDCSVSDSTQLTTRQQRAEEIAEAAQLNMANEWTPRQTFFDSLRKGSLLTILGEECGEDAAANSGKMKTGELAVSVNERLPHGWLPAPAASFFTEQPTDEGETSQAA